MTTAMHEGCAFPTPVPSRLIVFTVAVGYVLLLFGLDSIASFRVLTPGFAPSGALGGVLAYGLFLWLVDLRDPRIWRDPKRFADYVRAWADAAAQPVPDAASVDMLRLHTRREGGIALAQQGGMVAGVGAGIPLLDYGGFLAVLASGATMLGVGLALRRWLVGRD
jgi:hypothetical protein